MFVVRRFTARSLSTQSLLAPLRSGSSTTTAKFFARSQFSAVSSSQLACLRVTNKAQRRWLSDSRAAAADAAAAESSATELAADDVHESSVANENAETSSGAPSSRSIFVANLFYDISETQLREKMEKYGDVEDVVIKYDRRGLSRGYGFVTFRKQEDADAAPGLLDRQMWEGRMLTVKAANSRPFDRRTDGRMTAEQLSRRPDHPPSSTLYIGNLSYEMTDVDLNTLFRPVKNVVDVRVAIDRRTGQPRGFAHADFISVEAAQKGAEALRGQRIYGREIRVDFSTSYGPANTRYRQDADGENDISDAPNAATQHPQ